MDVPRAQRREYNDLYRAHQATTTQDALKMEMMLSYLAANNSHSSTPPPPSNSTQRSRENYPTRPVAARGRREVNNIPFNGTLAHGHGHGPGGGQQGPPTAVYARPAEYNHAPFAQNNVTSPPQQQVDGFRYQSPRLQQQQPVHVPMTKADLDFADRRRFAHTRAPGWCAKQILESPVDSWGLQAMLLQIRGGASSAGADAAEPVPAAPAAPAAVDIPNNTTKPIGPSVASAASDESSPYDYFDEERLVYEQLELDVPVTPSTSAYSDAATPVIRSACVIRISGANVVNAAGADQLVHLIATLVANSPRVIHAALAFAEPIAPGSHLGSFVPTPYDVSVKLLFSGPPSADAFAYASDIFQSLGGCILVKSVNQYDLDEHDEVIVDRVTRNNRF